MLTDIQDAYGHLLSDYHKGRETLEIVEREDGFIDTSRFDRFAILRNIRTGMSTKNSQ